MSKWVPFTVHIKVYPGKWTGVNSPDYAKLRKRFAIWRDMQKIAQWIYEGLETISTSIINIASPGGGQHRSYTGTDYAGLGGYVNGCAIVPQFGNKPALAQITGFYNSDSDNAATYPDLMRFNAGDTVEGSVKHSYDANPTTVVDSQVKTLKTTLENAIVAALPSSYDFRIFRIDYSGVVYGDRGFHFPQ